MVIREIRCYLHDISGRMIYSGHAGRRFGSRVETKRRLESQLWIIGSDFIEILKVYCEMFRKCKRVQRALV